MKWGKFGKLAALGVAVTLSAAAFTGCGGGDKAAEKKSKRSISTLPPAARPEPITPWAGPWRRS